MEYGEVANTSLSIIFKALSDPVRRKILSLLKDKDMTAGDIAAQFDISWPSISHHLNILKQAGMVVDERKGQNIYYSLNTSVFEEVVAFAFELLGRKDEETVEK
ncbi:MAG: autorepressor SdpR family transcription factor [Thermosediminibacteraceae bacterium]|nr:autorepressor SdpR family transcription factor [Thermosediminibacteraceae bacterium]